MITAYDRARNEAFREHALLGRLIDETDPSAPEYPVLLRREREKWDEYMAIVKQPKRAA